jgi:hypothetical protein
MRPLRAYLERGGQIVAFGASVLVNEPAQCKHLPRWIESFLPGYFMHRGVPWLCFDLIDWLDAALGDAPRVFEYGSGGSTRYWLRHDATVTSVEHNAGWYQVVRRACGGHPRLDYRLVEPAPLETGVVADASDPALYHSADPAYRQMDFRAYVTQIDAFPDAYFDVVLVDGRARAACIRNAAPKVKPGGMLIVDNANREWYLKQTRPLLAGFDCYVFRGLTPRSLFEDTTHVYIRRPGDKEGAGP